MLTPKEYKSAQFIRATHPESSLSLWFKHVDLDNLTAQQEKTIKQITNMNSATRRSYVIVDDVVVKCRNSRVTHWEKTEKGYKPTALKDIPKENR